MVSRRSKARGDKWILFPDFRRTGLAGECQEKMIRTTYVEKRAHGLDADEVVFADLPVGLACSDQTDHLYLPRGPFCRSYDTSQPAPWE